ncbi:MAG: LacI family DNA-binding transcriptional regulator [Hyphomicrobiales bacterium]
MAKRPTIADLARASGVSVATVDRVVNRRLPVREATAMRVAAAAEQIGYHATGLLKQRLAEVPHRDLGFILQKRNDEFYRSLASALSAATREASFIRGRPLVEFVDELIPAAIAAKLRDMAKRCDALAVVAVDHPHVNEAIEELSAAGTPVFTLLTDVSAPSRAGYAGIDSRKAGRTSAWAISRLAKGPGPVGVLVGTHRYLGQELAEISFRSYFREHAPEFRLLETVVDLEDDRIAYEATLDILGRNKSLNGIYLAGGGMKGMIDALRDEGTGGRVVAVCNELLPYTRAALIDGIVDLVLNTPLAQLSARVVEAMDHAIGGKNLEGMKQIQLPAELCVRENI